MLELRVLNGLHRGATLPLDERPHVIGASEEADVVLVDPGIEEQHATLTLTESGWLLTALEGELRTADSNALLAEIDLVPGDFARVGSIWLTVVEQDARWENPPPEPVDAAPEPEEDEMPVDEPPVIAAADMLDDESEAGDATAAGSAAGNASNRDSHEGTSSVDVQKPPYDIEPEHAVNGQRSRWRWRGRRMVLVPLTVATAISAAAYAITSKPESVVKPIKLDARAEIGRTTARPADKTLSAAFDALHAEGAPERQLTPEELRNAFRKRLSEVELLKRFDLTLQDHQWTMQAALDDEEAARFERTLSAFMKTHNINFPVHAKIGSAEAMLPFKIRQVISGANASVVTQEGDRVYIGEEYRGVRLVAVNDNQLTFQGKRKIEVRW